MLRKKEDFELNNVSIHIYDNDYERVFLSVGIAGFWLHRDEAKDMVTLLQAYLEEEAHDE